QPEGVHAAGRVRGPAGRAWRHRRTREGRHEQAARATRWSAAVAAAPAAGRAVMKEFFTTMSWWQWLVFAVVLAALETVLPGAVAIWFAASAAFIGLLLIVLDIPWQWQWIGFAVLGLVAMLWYLQFREKHPEKV